MKKQILSDMLEAEMLGLTVRPCSFGSQGEMRCCPITAVAIAKVGPDKLCYDKNRFREELIIPIVCERLDVDKPWVLGFIRGYDTAKGEQLSKAASYKEGFKLGREIHNETCK
jgi:hypothetical protein